MKNLIVIFVLLLQGTAGDLNSQPTVENELIIHFSGVKNSKGHILIALCATEKEFPEHPSKGYEVPKTSISNNKMSYSIKGINIGTYAIALLDDENNNKKMDYNFIGIPQEGYGFSNDAKPKFLSPPGFKDCSFTIKPGKNDIYIKLNYF